MTLVEFARNLDDTLSFYDEDKWPEVEVNVLRYNTIQTLDRIIIHQNGRKEVDLVFVDQPKRDK